MFGRSMRRGATIACVAASTEAKRPAITGIHATSLLAACSPPCDTEPYHHRFRLLAQFLAAGSIWCAVLLWMCLMVLLASSRSIPVDRGYARPRRHPLGGDDHDVAALLQDQLPQVVEQVVNLRVRQVVERDPAGRGVDPAGHLAVGFDEQRRNPSGHGRFGDLRQVIGASPLGPCPPELLDQSGQARRYCGSTTRQARSRSASIGRASGWISIPSAISNGLWLT